MSSELEAQVQALIAKLPPHEQSMVRSKIVRILNHRRALVRFPTPGHLGQFNRPGFLQTPMLDAIDAAIMRAESGVSRQIIINTPPQEGKTTRIQDACAWLLLRDPTLRIAFASYEQGIASQSGLAIRQMLEAHGAGYRGQKQPPDRVDELGLMLDPDRSLNTNWSLAEVPGDKNKKPGGVLSVGIGSSFTGRPADILVVDDPLKDAKQADSPVYRKAVVDWYQSTANTRLSPNAIVIIIQCMTGDTPVLMADGHEKPLRDVRAGDSVATFEGGALATSKIINWTNQGPDTIYAIKMKSGRTVRANARHPFLTIENGVHVWQRTETLKPGSFIQAVTRESAQAQPVQSTDATGRPSARACACRTTTNTAGPAVSGLHQSTPPAGGRLTSSTDTDSPPPTTMPSWPSRTGGVRSASNTQPPETLAPTGTGNSAWTTTTTPDACAGCCATTATLQLGTESQPPSFAPPLTTWSPEPDEVVQVTECGIEDVFDIQVARTENFIANGLVSHNTRWHEEDLTGWLLAKDAEEIFPEWEHINIQALAEEDDVLGRQPGEFLLSARGRTTAQWKKKKRDVGTRWWGALYQGDPSPPGGGTFQRAWFDAARVEVKPEMLYVETVVDPADNDGTGDEAGIITGGIGANGEYYILEDNSGHYTVAAWVRTAIFAVLRNRSSRLAFEKSLSGLRRSISAEWKVLRKQARELALAHKQWSKFSDGDTWPEKLNMPAINQVRELLGDEDDSPEDTVKLERQLVELWPYVARLLKLPTSGPSIKAITPVGSKTWRAETVSPDFENGKVHAVGTFTKLEKQMCTWLPTQDSPDRMDACVHLITDLRNMSVGPKTGVQKAKPEQAPLPARQQAMPQILRSTRY